MRFEKRQRGDMELRVNDGSQAQKMGYWGYNRGVAFLGNGNVFSSST